MNREIEAITAACTEAKRQGIQTALATVVHVEGSSYRRAGARMLVDEYGNMTGAISGGCLEGDALLKALHAISQKENKLVTYDTSDENDSVVGAQLGCEGVIRVLFEPINYDDPLNAVEMIRQADASRKASALVTLFNLNRKEYQIGTQFLVWADDCLEREPAKDNNLAALVQNHSREVISAEKSAFKQYEEGSTSFQAYIEYFALPKKLVLVGAGNDARAFSQVASGLGWEIVVVDGRPTHASRDRFLPSCRIIVSRPEKMLENLEVDNRSFFLLMTHNYQYDLAVLTLLLAIPDIPYIGILGPQKKFGRMLNDLKRKGVELTSRDKQRIFAPMGLDIGAETPEEIAVSVLAEMSTIMTNTTGEHLRDKNGPIHENQKSEFERTVL